MAVLRAPATGVAQGPAPLKRLKLLVLLGAAVAVLLAFVPPIWTEAHRYEFVEAVQFALLAFAAPALLVAGGLWGHLPQSARSARGSRLRLGLERLEAGRRRHPDFWRSGMFAAVDVGLVMMWRTPLFMDAVARHGWVVVPEAVSLVGAGVGLWLELLSCPPLSPRLNRPWGAVLAVGTMWAIWILVYAVGFAHVSWYRAFDHAGSLMNPRMDQEVATGVVWFASACAFAPVVFADIVNWLKADEDPDAELRRLVRASRRSGRS